ncbi:unnamed protein product [Schistosoma margrebowiei]|uniref:Uncharacterized protein n=1 Tax=Schistosoma margrebowiei TaxID=48269 RepID=A0A183LMB4_9TREM|nr:unnamed protein product [Schistosoma margrebowiei]
MVVEGSRQETLELCFVLLGTRRQGVPVILRELVLPEGFDPVSPSFTIRDVTTELSGPLKIDENNFHIHHRHFLFLIQSKMTIQISIDRYFFNFSSNNSRINLYNIQ